VVSITYEFCTWKGCNNLAQFPQKAKDGDIWADLCSSHHKSLEKKLGHPNVKDMIKSWILAQGGSKKATRRIL